MKSYFLNAKKQNKSKKTHKTPNSLPTWELLLFVIYSHWVGRKRGISGWPDRPGPASIQSIRVWHLTSAESSFGDKTPTPGLGRQGVPTNPITQRSSLTQPAPAEEAQTNPHGRIAPTQEQGHQGGGDNPREGVSGKIRNKITARSTHLCHCSNGEELLLTH